MATSGCGCTVIVTSVGGLGDPPLANDFRENAQGSPWLPFHLKASPKLGIRVIISGRGSSLPPPFPLTAAIGGDLEAFT